MVLMDFLKAFDTLRWDAIYKTIELMGYNDTF